jgi:hypothetical protein
MLSAVFFILAGLAVPCMMEEGAGPFLEQLTALHRALVGEDYDASVIPWQGPSAGPVVVNASFHLQNIVSLQEKAQILTIKVFLIIKWLDPRVKWDPLEYQGIERIHVPPNTLWKPDIVIENSASGSQFLSEMDGFSFLEVYSTGEVVWAPFLLSETFCGVDATYFPLDEQTCNVSLSSWVYGSHQLLINAVHNPSTATDHFSTEWGVRAIRTSIGSTYEYEGVQYYHARFSIVMARHMSLAALVMLLPCAILTLLTLLMFILPPQQRMDLGLAIWTSLVFLLLLINDTSPGSSGGRLPILGAYIILMLLLVTVSLVLVIVSTLYHGARLADLPACLQLLIYCLETVLGLLAKRQSPTAPADTTETASKGLDRLSISVQIVLVAVVVLYTMINYI